MYSKLPCITEQPSLPQVPPQLYHPPRGYPNCPSSACPQQKQPTEKGGGRTWPMKKHTKSGARWKQGVRVSASVTNVYFLTPFPHSLPYQRIWGVTKGKEEQKEFWSWKEWGEGDSGWGRFRLDSAQRHFFQHQGVDFRDDINMAT